LDGGLSWESRMPSALSVDLRERVIAAIETGPSRCQAAKRFGVGAASAIRWPNPFRQEGRIAPKPSGGDDGSRAMEAQADRILALWEAHPQIVLRELRDALAEQDI
jgi:transposase